ncbi:hypothetical protein AN958_03065, partial [Leucoagaricus sp. SymC.cos]
LCLNTCSVEDCSPLILYAPPDAWEDAEVTDSLAASYSGSSYHQTSIQGANATFQFNGTRFLITGGRRPGYGPFSISLDGQELFNGNPAPESSLINNTLASVSGLPNERHTVVLTNTGGVVSRSQTLVFSDGETLTGGAPVDIDAITFETPITSSGVNFSVMTIDDSDPRINYLPPNSWSSNFRPEFQNGTLHFSQVPDATASLQFSGNAVALYGTVSPDHADISVTIDGGTVTMPNGSSSRVLAVRPGVLMYWVDNLAEGQHTLIVRKAQGGNTGPFVDIDSFVIYSSTQTAASGESSSNSQQPHDYTAAIIGATVAGVVALLLVIAGLFLFLRYQRLRHKSGINKASISPVTSILPMQGMMESGFNRSSTLNGENSVFTFPPSASLTPLRKTAYHYKRSSKLSIAPSYYGDSDFSDGDMSLNRNQTTSAGASDPPIPLVPRLATPSRAPGSPRTVPVVIVTDTASPSQLPRPSRPRRPPTLTIGSLQ